MGVDEGWMRGRGPASCRTGPLPRGVLGLKQGHPARSKRMDLPAGEAPMPRRRPGGGEGDVEGRGGRDVGGQQGGGLRRGLWGGNRYRRYPPPGLGKLDAASCVSTHFRCGQLDKYKSGG